MESAAASIAIFAIQEAIKEAPDLIADFQKLFAAGEPTASDFEALRAKWRPSYRDYVPKTDLPRTEAP